MERFHIFGSYNVGKRRGNAVIDKLSVSDRRDKIMDILEVQVSSTCGNLATNCGVTIDTIRRDIDYLTPRHPITYKRGNGGGVFLEFGYRRGKRQYFSGEEEDLLYRLAVHIDNENDEDIIVRMIAKFTEVPLTKDEILSNLIGISR